MYVPVYIGWVYCTVHLLAISKIYRLKLLTLDEQKEYHLVLQCFANRISAICAFNSEVFA